MVKSSSLCWVHSGLCCGFGLRQRSRVAFESEPAPSLSMTYIILISISFSSHVSLRCSAPKLAGLRLNWLGSERRSLPTVKNEVQSELVRSPEISVICWKNLQDLQIKIPFIVPIADYVNTAWVPVRWAGLWHISGLNNTSRCYNSAIKPPPNSSSLFPASGLSARLVRSGVNSPVVHSVQKAEIR